VFLLDSSLGKGLLFWAKRDLAQARRPRLGKNSQSAHCATVAGLAQARMPSVNETDAISWAKASSLNENNAGLCFIFLIEL